MNIVNKPIDRFFFLIFLWEYWPMSWNLQMFDVFDWDNYLLILMIVHSFSFVFTLFQVNPRKWPFYLPKKHTNKSIIKFHCVELKSDCLVHSHFSTHYMHAAVDMSNPGWLTAAIFITQHAVICGGCGDAPYGNILEKWAPISAFTQGPVTFLSKHSNSARAKSVRERNRPAKLCCRLIKGCRIICPTEHSTCWVMSRWLTLFWWLTELMLKTYCSFVIGSV